MTFIFKRTYTCKGEIENTNLGAIVAKGILPFIVLYIIKNGCTRDMYARFIFFIYINII